MTHGPQREHVGLRIQPGRHEWELYDMEADRCELNDLARQFPHRVAEMTGQWDAWYERCMRESGHEE